MSRADDIAEIAGHVKKVDRVCFITGAGASKSAGVPLAGELISEINSEYGYCLTGLAEAERLDYGKVMSRLSPRDRIKLLGKYLESCPISWGQIALATIVKWAVRERKEVVRVLTFNFDLVLENAASLLGLQLPVYDFGGGRGVLRMAPYAIVHLHGQNHGFVLLNSEAETARQREYLRPVLSDAVRTHLTIVAGYSGEYDGAFEVVREEYDNFNWLIWLGYDEAAKRHLTPLLKNRYFKYVGGCDYDRTMIALAKELGIWPPEIIRNPLQHLLDQLSAVGDYPVGDAFGIDVLAGTRERLSHLSDRWAAERTTRDRAAAVVIGGDTGADSVEGLQAAPLTGEDRLTLAGARVQEGGHLCEQARRLSGPEAAAMFAESYRKYAQALNIVPDLPEALYNWANAVRDEARTTLSGSAASAKFADSYRMYEQAVALKPDMHPALIDWAAALGAEAETLSGREAAARFADSYDKYYAALYLLHRRGILRTWQYAQLKTARDLDARTHADLIETAESMLRKQQSLTGKGNYKLAGILALTGRQQEALVELVRCRNDAELPDRAHLEANRDLESLRLLPEFQAILDSFGGGLEATGAA